MGVYRHRSLHAAGRLAAWVLGEQGGATQLQKAIRGGCLQQSMRAARCTTPIFSKRHFVRILPPHFADMLGQMEHLRFLRRAVLEELITEAEFAQHKQRLLQPGTGAVAPGVLVSCLKADPHQARPSPVPPPPAISEEGKERQIYHALMAAILELVDNQATKERRIPPLADQKQQPRSVPVKPGRRKQVVISPGRVEAGPRSPSFQPGTQKATHSCSSHHKFVGDSNTDPLLITLDPLEFDLDELWHEPETQAAATKPKPAAIRCKAVKPCSVNATVRIAAGGRLQRQNPARSRYRQDQEQRQERKVDEKPPARPPVTRIARPPLVPRVHPRSPAAVRRAAAFVAHAAGLKPKAAAPQGPAAPAEPRAQAAPVAAPAAAAKAMGGTSPTGPRPRAVKISLHAEVWL